jgi:hypothetical protein
MATLRALLSHSRSTDLNCERPAPGNRETHLIRPTCTPLHRPLVYLLLCESLPSQWLRYDGCSAP